MTRSVVIRMRRRSSDEPVEPFRHREHAPEGHALREELESWAAKIPSGRWPAMPEQITDRNADVWEALLAVADTAGGDWPKRARTAAVTLVTAVSQSPPGLGVQLLADLRSVFLRLGEERVSTETLLERLNGMEEAPWGNIRGNPLDARGLARRLRRYEVGPKPIRDGAAVFKGYDATDFADPWSRYLTPSTDSAGSDESVTNGTADTDRVSDRSALTEDSKVLRRGPVNPARESPPG
jgi:hypothetical protein